MNSLLGITTGAVNFELKNETHYNNSIVTLEDIGERDVDALLCKTNQTACCIHIGDLRPPIIIGNWFFPNGTRVPSEDVNDDFYRNRGEMVVRMHRRRGGVDGIYRCEIPDAAGASQTIYIGVYQGITGELTLFLFYCNYYN